MLQCLPLSKCQCYTAIHSQWFLCIFQPCSPAPSGPSDFWFLHSFVPFPLGNFFDSYRVLQRFLGWYFSRFKPSDFGREEKDSSLRSAQQGTLYEDPCCGVNILKDAKAPLCPPHPYPHSGGYSEIPSCRYLLSWLAQSMPQWNASHVAPLLSSNKKKPLSVAHVAVLLPTAEVKTRSVCQRNSNGQRT